ncbi:hypothetical protein AMJ52_04325 [candidate division TA06 bacterium DG_78]|uniref:Protein kinase domain-containing protein n=1 Tax=candidate division TA06 bacterium DG_78 TaxID=1703772 RepID=A0A0S7YEX5_UNCT6|nr:MAG: hypothetical protein AMJ52_04325 [candidate division TA06 bacterium DG_78]
MQHWIVDNRYKILKKQGAGATGKVYKVKDLRDQRIMALKMLSREETSSEEIQRFKREFKLLTRLHHPNLCSVYDFGVLKDGRSYFTMEYVDGKNIFQAAGGASRATLCTWIVQLCRVLEYIHAKGLIHFDIKPSNVLIAKGIEFRSEGTRILAGQSARGKKHYALSSVHCAKLMDFGLAGEQRIKGGAFIKGTFPYIAPEVVKGLAVDHRADIYSLGVLLYEVLTRKHFKAAEKESFASILKQQDYYSESVTKIIDDIPHELGRMLVRLITVEPAMRFSRANEIIKEINRLTGLRFALETEKTLEGYLLSSRFVDREKEMQLLTSSYERARRGKGNVVLVIGEAGIGKSRLVREFKITTQLQRSHAFLGYAYRDKLGALDPFYYVFSELINYIKPTSRLKSSLAILFKIFPDLADGHLNKNLPILATLDPKQEKLRNFEALSELIYSVAADLGEIIILLEDLHWADDLSLQFLEYLGRNLIGKNIFICATCREEGLKERASFKRMISSLKNQGCLNQVVLRSLTLRSLHEFIDSTITSTSNSSALVRYLMEKTNGNPFFVEEIMRTLLKIKGVCIGEKLEIDSIKKFSVPKTIEDTVLKRIEDLDRTPREIVKVAAVFLRGFTYEVIKKLMKLDDTELSRALWELRRRQILVERGVIYLFSHATLREVLHKQLSNREKKELNYRIGEVLETDNMKNLEPVIEDVAYYFINAQDHKRGVEYGLRAAEKSSSRYANEQAIQFYKSVLGLLNNKNLKMRFDVLQKLAYIETLIGCYNDAIKSYSKALNLKTGTIDEKIKIYGKLAYVYESSGNWSGALQMYRKALGFLKQVKSRRMKASLGAEFNIKLCRSYLMLGNYEKAHKFNVRTFKFLKNIKGKEAIRLKGSVYGSIGDVEFYMSEYGRGSYDKAISYYKQAYKYYKRADNDFGVAAVLNNLGISYQLKFDYQKASVYYQKSIKVSERIGEQQGVSIRLLNLGNILKERGYYLKALTCFQKALAISKKIGTPLITGGVLLELGNCYLALCNYSEAETSTKQALKILDEIGWTEKKIFALMVLGDINHSKGDYTVSLEYHRKALKITRESGQQRAAGRVLVLMSFTFLEIGEISRAKRYGRDALKIAAAFALQDVEIECYTTFCQIHLMMHDYALAHDYCKKGVGIAKKLKMKRRLVQLFLLLTEIYYYEKKYHEGFEMACRAADTARNMGAKDVYVKALLMKAKHGYKVGVLSQTDSTLIYNEAIKLAEEINYPEILWKVHFAYGEMHQENRAYRKALRYYKKCIKTLVDVTSIMKHSAMRKCYLHRSDRQAVFAAIDGVEKSTSLS